MRKWLDRMLEKGVPEEIEAFCFNLYEQGNGVWMMELVGAGEFDLENEDWVCSEVTDFGTWEKSHKCQMECDWMVAMGRM